MLCQAVRQRPHSLGAHDSDECRVSSFIFCQPEKVSQSSYGIGQSALYVYCYYYFEFLRHGINSADVCSHPLCRHLWVCVIPMFVAPVVYILTWITKFILVKNRMPAPIRVHIQWVSCAGWVVVWCFCRLLVSHLRRRRFHVCIDVTSDHSRHRPNKNAYERWDHHVCADMKRMIQATARAKASQSASRSVSST